MIGFVMVERVKRDGSVHLLLQEVIGSFLSMPCKRNLFQWSHPSWSEGCFDFTRESFYVASAPIVMVLFTK